MAFTYTEDLSIDRDYVRFQTGDTDEATAFLSDATITSLVSTYGRTEAVIQALQYIIRRLSQPNFRADWLQVDYEKARAGFQKMLDDKQIELGRNRITARAGHAYRADSRQTETPTYDATNWSQFDDDEDGLW